MSLNPFNPDDAKSRIYKIYNIINWVKMKNKQHHNIVLLNSIPMNGNTLRRRKLCITQGLTLGVKELTFFSFTDPQRTNV